MKTRTLTTVAMLSALGVVLSIIESYIPLFSVIPGLKLGLANIVIVFALYKFGFKVSLSVSLVRILLVAMLRVGFGINFIFSLAGAFLSIIVMYLTMKTKLSIIGVSVLGSISHSIGQILIAIVLLNNKLVIYYLPYLLILSIPTGVIIGLISKKMLEYSKNVI